jgi:transposase
MTQNIKNKAIRYSEDFQRTSAQLATSTDQPMSRTAKELGVDPSTLRAWVRKHCPNYEAATSGTVTQAHLEAEVKQLRKQLAQAQLERDILKKATAYFASEQL